MRPIAVYSALRLGLFAACLVLLLALGARGLLAVLGAAAVSLALSFVILRRQRESVAQAWLASRERRADRPATGEADAAAEDAAIDAAERAALVERPDRADEADRAGGATGPGSDTGR
ncbi:MAG: DUF4229 domain-containing protein [Kineosporiaceae bacterium]